MATNTPNYNLVKPSYTEFADVQILNGNADIIDTQMKNNKENIDNHKVLVATPSLLGHVKGGGNITIGADGILNTRNGTTAQTGVLRLTSEVNSDSETLAATPKAIKTVNDAVKEVDGSLPFAVDANNIGTVGKITRHRTNENTLNSPYILGLVGSARAGFIETYLSSSAYGVQYYRMSSHTGGKTYELVRYLDNGNWSDWLKIGDMLGDTQNYLPYTGSLKGINYNARVYAHGTATDRPTTSTSYYVEVIVRGDSTNNRVLIARAYNSKLTYIMHMVSGVWTEWSRIDNEWSIYAGDVKNIDYTCQVYCSSSEVSNLPPPVTGYYVEVSVKGDNNSYRKLTARRFGNNEVWEMVMNNGVWGTWEKISSGSVSNNHWATATGTNVLTVTLAGVTLTAGLHITFKNTTANTDSVTLNFNGSGAKPVVKNGGAALTNGMLKAGYLYTVVYDGVNFILNNEGGEYGNAVASEVLSGKTIGTENGIVTGTMPNRGVFNLGLGVTVPAGYYSGGTTANGKRYATGTINSDVSSFLIVSGLNFTAKKIIARLVSNKTHSFALYDADITSQILIAYPSPQSYDYVANTNGYVNNTGFKIYVPSPSSSFVWEAYE